MQADELRRQGLDDLLGRVQHAERIDGVPAAAGMAVPKALKQLYQLSVRMQAMNFDDELDERLLILSWICEEEQLCICNVYNILKLS